MNTHATKIQYLSLTVYTALSLCISYLFTGCSSSSEDLSPLEAVPDGSHYIAVIDAESLAKEYSQFIPADLTKPVGKVVDTNCQAVDLKQIVTFRTAKGYSGAIIKIVDREKLLESLESSIGESKQTDDYTVFTVSGRKIAIGENLCCIAPDMETIKKIGRRGSGQPISQMEGVMQFLSEDGDDVRSATLASDLYGKKMNGLWLCNALHCSQESISLEISLMQPDGESGEIGKMLADEIDPDVLRFIPSGCSLVAATGKQQDGAKMFGLESILRSYLPVDPNISQTGTTAWYGRPAGTLSSEDLLNPRVWNIAAISQMPQNESVLWLDNFKDQYGQYWRENPETGCYTVSAMGVSLTVGYYEGYSLTGVNGDFSFNNSNSYTQDFQGARMVILIDIPKGSNLQRAAELPCGASLAIKATADNIRTKLCFYGNSESALITLGSINQLGNLLPFVMGI